MSVTVQIQEKLLGWEEKNDHAASKRVRVGDLVFDFWGKAETREMELESAKCLFGSNTHEGATMTDRRIIVFR